jgi:hypothetical protein
LEAPERPGVCGIQLAQGNTISGLDVGMNKVRHVWSCENCGHEIEMAVNLRVQNLERKKIRARYADAA